MLNVAAHGVGNMQGLANLSKLVSALKLEHARHGRTLAAPELWVMATYHFGRWANDSVGLPKFLGSKAYGLMMLSMELATGCTIHREAELGEGFHLVHVGNVKIHPEARIGRNVGVMHDVTIGRTPERLGVPVIDDDVFIGAGAKILGPVHIGAGARIAANSLVISDVPAGTTAIGVPARVLRYTGRPTPTP